MSQHELEEQLKNLVLEYAKDKEKLDEYEDICESKNQQIKDIMSANKFSECRAGDYIAKYSVQHRESMNEEMLLDILKTAPGISTILDTIIKTKEYIDFDSLEAAIYNEKFSKDTLLKMNGAKQSKDIAILKVTKIKKKKGEE